MIFRTSALLALVALVSGGCAATFIDVGPNLPDGSGDTEDGSSSGLIYALDGDRHTMYAVSLNAGIWKREEGQPWKQLRKSSALTTSFAVDPTSPRHLVSGDRDNNASEATADIARFDRHLGGIWESFDSGTSWTLAFSPLTWFTNTAAPVRCNSVRSQAIPAITITPTGTILAGTACGIARKASGQPSYSLTATPIDVGLVTAFAVARRAGGATLVWALAQRSSNGQFVLLSSATDGASWNLFVIPLSVNGNGIPIAQGGNDIPASRGDAFSLAAFGDTAVMAFRPVPDLENRTGVLYFRLSDNLFWTQILDGANNGTGLGGRRSLRTVNIRPPFAVADGVRVFLNTAQDVLEAKGVDSSGSIDWEHRARTRCSDCDDTDPIHPDIWDVLPSTENDDYWLATDGGVYLAKGSFSSFNDGLFTHHIHSLAILKSAGLSGTTGPRLTYATSDNDAWHWDGSSPSAPSTQWRSYRVLGDANWVAADRGNSALALEVRDGVNADLTDFDAGAPSGTDHVGGDLFNPSCAFGLDKDGNQICVDNGFLPRNFQVIQTGPRALGFKTGTFLDVVWLRNRPLQYKDGDSVVNLPGTGLSNPTGGSLTDPLLLRNFALAVQPDIDDSKFKGWFVESGNVPAGATRVWASVAIGSFPWQTVYYVCTCGGSSTPAIFKRSVGSTTWQPIDVAVGVGPARHSLEIANPTEPGNAPVEIGGPLFVDPINPDRIVALTTIGVAISSNGGTDWTLDGELTALLTDSGTYPLATGFPSGNGNNVVLASRGLRFMYASDVAFGWGDNQLAVASPFTGVFVRGSDSQPWLNVTAALPTPLPTVSAIAFDATELYVATEGRSLVRTLSMYSAPTATYFKRTRSPASGVLTISLMASVNKPLAGKTVAVTVVGADGAMHVASLVADSAGRMPYASTVQAGDRAFFSFKGDSTNAAAKMTFEF